jgi:glycerate kinase
VGFGLSVAPQNQREDEDGVGHASGSSGLLHLEASQARVSQLCLKTGGGATADGARGIIAEVAWM